MPSGQLFPYIIIILPKLFSEEKEKKKNRQEKMTLLHQTTTHRCGNVLNGKWENKSQQQHDEIMHMCALCVPVQCVHN